MQQLMQGCTALPGPQMGGAAGSPADARMDPLIEKDIALAKQVPVTGTPTYIFIYKGKSYPRGVRIGFLAAAEAIHRPTIEPITMSSAWSDEEPAYRAR
jgi:hypothetical protein